MTKLLAQVKDIDVPMNLRGLKFLGTGAGMEFNNASLVALIIARVLLFAIIISGLIFFFRLISAGYAYLTSGGDSAKLQTASKSLLNALIGFVVVLTSFFIIQIIETLFGINIINT